VRKRPLTTNGLLLLLGVLAGSARADDEATCNSRVPSAPELDYVIGHARALVRPSRVARETFDYCTYDALGGRRVSASVATVRHRRSDTTQTWSVVSCSRHFERWDWSCLVEPIRMLRGSATASDGMHEYRAYLESASDQPSLDPPFARRMAAAAFEILTRPLPMIAECGASADAAGTAPQMLARGTTTAPARLRLSRSGDQYYVELGYLQLILIEAAGALELHCWNSLPLVIE
jgi:hypothetical protein